MSTNFISDFMELNSKTECHRSYLMWAAVAALGITSGPRYRLLNGNYYIHPQFYIMFVGPQGSRKTYGMNQIRKLIEEAFPDHPMGASVTSRDDIIRLISSTITERAYVDAETCSTTYHPLSLFISEFKVFTAYSPSMMIDFLVDIYDYADRVYDCSTIKRGAEVSEHPFLTVLACENTDWFLRRLKEGIVTGGFSRRFIVIYEWDKPKEPFPWIEVPKNYKLIYERMLLHLRELRSTAKDYTWTEEGRIVFKKWYVKNFNTRQDDASIAGFRSTQDQALLKLCIALDLAEPKEKRRYLITKELIEEGLVWYEANDPNLIKLYSSGGRNELRAEQIKMVDLINSRGGLMTEKEVLHLTGKDLGVRDQIDSIKILCDTGELIKKPMKWPDAEKSGMKVWLVTAKGMENEKLAKAVRT